MNDTAFYLVCFAGSLVLVFVLLFMLSLGKTAKMADEQAWQDWQEWLDEHGLKE